MSNDILATAIPYGYNDGKCIVLKHGETVMFDEDNDGVPTFVHNKLKCDIQIREECDKCLEYKPVMSVVDKLTVDEEGYTVHLCADCMLRMIELVGILAWRDFA